MKAFFHTVFFTPLYNIFILIVALMPGHNIGLAIIVLTILVRLILTPLKFKSIESQAKQKMLAPELRRIKEQYIGDKAGESAATMQMYKEKGINPASGCLPLLIQLPVLLVLYYVFRAGINPADHKDILYSFIPHVDSVSPSFLWLKDITKTDPTFILPILAGVAQFFFSRSMMSQIGDPTGDKGADMTQVMSKQMMYFFPFMTIFIARSLPAALSIYWVVATLVDWYQQNLGMKKYMKEHPASDKASVTVRHKKTKEAKS